jgi:hypothetical protein
MTQAPEYQTPIEATVAAACVLLTAAQQARRVARHQLYEVQHHGTRGDEPAGEAINRYMIELGGVVDTLDDALHALENTRQHLGLRPIR